MELTFSLGDISNAADRFLAIVFLPRVIAFHGEMGAGKTTFIHAVCDRLGVTDIVGSPTFSIINEYRTDPPLEKIFHLDLYRLRDEEEASRAGVEDVLCSGFTCFAEWPEKAPGIFPDDTVHVHLELMPDDRRRLKIGQE